MTEKLVVVTGATSGIGRAVALQLAARGAGLIVTGRDARRGGQTEAALRTAGASSARFVMADHSTREGNVAFAAAVRESVPRVDVLVNNVGGLLPHYQLTADGVETTMALNFRAAVVVTDELRPRLSPGGVVVNVASDAFARADDDPFAPGPSAAVDYEPFEAYARAKLLLVLATLGHARRMRSDRVQVLAVNPGPAWTPGNMALTPACVPAPLPMWPIVRLVQRSRSAERAARTVTQAAVSPPGSGCYVTARGKVRDLAALRSDLESQERALQLAWSLGSPQTGVSAVDREAHRG